MRYPTRVVALSALCVLAALNACGGKAKPKATPPPTPKTTSAAPSTSAAPPTPTGPAPLTVNPLTGLAPVPAGPVVAVKIDDTSAARPQRNINAADIVYIEEVEGGYTRLLAVFAANKPVVEAVRSTRASDPELMAQYGAITYVASGGAPNPLQVLDGSPLKSDINDRNGPGFARDYNRNMPYNLTADLAKISTAVPGVGVQNVGFTWSPDTAALASAPVANTVSTTIGNQDVRFDYDAGSAHYVRLINGVRQRQADGNFVVAANVIVQFCSVTPYPQDRDVNGAISQYTHTIGSGPVSIFRNGHRIDGTWSRPTGESPTTYADASGKPIDLAPGGAWVALTATGKALTSG